MRSSYSVDYSLICDSALLVRQVGSVVLFCCRYACSFFAVVFGFLTLVGLEGLAFAEEEGNQPRLRPRFKPMISRRSHEGGDGHAAGTRPR
jgi:hypothetical protein